MTDSGNPTLRAVAERQSLWSAAAGKLKARVDRARVTVLGLGVAGAVLETAAGTLLTETAKSSAAWAGAACLALIPVLSARALGRDRVDAWARARSASEPFKAEAFQFRAQAEPYDNPETADAALHAEMVRIDDAVDDIRAHTANVQHTAKAWSARLTPAEFIDQRVLQQANTFYRPKADDCKVLSDRFRVVEFALALVAAALGAAAGAGATGFTIGGRPSRRRSASSTP